MKIDFQPFIDEHKNDLSSLGKKLIIPKSEIKGHYSGWLNLGVQPSIEENFSKIVFGFCNSILVLENGDIISNSPKNHGLIYPYTEVLKFDVKRKGFLSKGNILDKNKKVVGTCIGNDSSIGVSLFDEFIKFLEDNPPKETISKKPNPKTQISVTSKKNLNISSSKSPNLNKSIKETELEFINEPNKDKEELFRFNFFHEFQIDSHIEKFITESWIVTKSELKIYRLSENDLTKYENLISINKIKEKVDFISYSDKPDSFYDGGWNSHTEWSFKKNGKKYIIDENDNNPKMTINTLIWNDNISEILLDDYNILKNKSLECKYKFEHDNLKLNYDVISEDILKPTSSINNFDLKISKGELNSLVPMIFYNYKIELDVIQEDVSLGFLKETSHDEIQRFNDFYSNLLILIQLGDELFLNIEKNGHQKLTTLQRDSLISIRQNIDEKIINPNIFLELMKINQSKINEINRDYIHQLIKLNSHIERKYNNVISFIDILIEKLIDTKKSDLIIRDYELTFLDELFNEYNTLIKYSLNMITTLVEDDMISYYQLYEVFDKENIFSSNWENEISQKFDLLNSKLNDINFSLNKVINEIRNLNTNITSKLNRINTSLVKMEDSINLQLSEVNSKLHINNLKGYFETTDMFKWRIIKGNNKL